jgi:hypothetical protein
MELTGRQKKFLTRAYQAAKDEQDRFFIEDVGARLKLPPSEAIDTANALRREHDCLEFAPDVAPYNPETGEWGPRPKAKGTFARLTLKGRETARHLLDDSRAERRKKWWTALKWGWGTVMTVALPVSVALLNRKIERHERALERATAIPTTMPVTSSAASPATIPATGAIAIPVTSPTTMP